MFKNVKIASTKTYRLKTSVESTKVRELCYMYGKTIKPH